MCILKNTLRIVALTVLFATLMLAQGTLKIGFMPYLSSTALLSKYQPLAEYLSKIVGKEFEVVVAKDYKNHIESCGEEKIDICFLGGSPYIIINKNYTKKPILAGFEFNNRATFRSVIFVKKNSPIKDLKSLEGKRVAFGSVNSTLSTHIPLYMLMELGLSLDVLKQYKHLRNHENVYYGVLYGDFDAGAVAEEIFNELQSENISVLQYSKEVATHLFVARSNMDQKLFQEIQHALISLDDTEILGAINPNLTGFVKAQESDYSYHKQMIDAVSPLLGLE